MATKLGTTNKLFLVATKTFAAATKRFVNRTEHFVVVTEYFCYPYFNKWFCWYNKTFFFRDKYFVFFGKSSSFGSLGACRWVAVFRKRDLRFRRRIWDPVSAAAAAVLAPCVGYFGRREQIALSVLEWSPLSLATSPHTNITTGL